MLAALDLRWCDNDFGRAYLEPLLTRDPAELPWLVAEAIRVQRLSGADTLPARRESSARLRSQVSDFDERVEQQARSDDPFRRRVGEVARAVMSGQPVASLWH